MSLQHVATSAAAAIGVAGFEDHLGFGDTRHAVVVLIDGLGWQLLQQHASAAPNLTAVEGSKTDTVFPSTTPTALGALGTGSLAGAHGLMGGSFWLPEADVVLNPLQWPAEVSPIATQPEPTVFERAERAGVRVTTIADGKFADSGLTRAVLRGGAYVPSQLTQSGSERLAVACGGSEASLTYVYWGALDRIGHEFGAGSREWLRALREVDALVANLADRLPADGVMLVTADHGMVNCPPDARIDISDDPELMAGVVNIAGEPRVRHIYCSDDPQQVARRWAARLQGRAQVLTREELIDTGLLGPVDPELVERIGDVVTIARDNVSLTSRADRRVSELLGQHGALTEIEREIPLLWFRGAGR